MSWFVYALRSEKDGRLYIGLSGNPKERVLQHNSGMTKSTKPYRPYRLIYTQSCNSRFEARKLELKLKSGFGREFLKKIK